MALPVRFSELFAVIIFWVWWALVLLAHVESPAGRRQLLTSYGLNLAVGAVAICNAIPWVVSAIDKLVVRFLPMLPVGRREWRAWPFVIVALAAVYWTLEFQSKFVNVLVTWRDLTQVGPGALGVFIDYLGMTIVAFTHVTCEAYRRQWGPSMQTLAWTVSVLLAPAIAYPLFLAFALPTGTAGATNDSNGVKAPLGLAAPAVFGVEAVMIL